MQSKWTAVDNYFDELLIGDDDILAATLAASDAAELPPINVVPNQGKLLMLFAMMHGAKTILEIGTLGGYSTIWLARALPDDGKLITLEYEAHHAQVAQTNIERAGVADKVQIIVGDARESLPRLTESAPFDFIFIDADKPNNPFYLEWSLKFSRVGSVIFADNVVRDGEVVNANSDDPKVIGTQRMLEMMSQNPRLTVAALQTVGSKGYDGFALAVVTS